jgi:hypothetical protein
MTQLRLTEKADLGLMYDAEKMRYDPAIFAALQLTRERFIEFYAGAPSLGYEIDGLPAGGALFHHQQLHLAILPQFYGRWAWLLKPTLEWLFDMQDPVEVQIEKHNTRCVRFMEAGQWPRVAENEQLITYLLSRENNRIFRPRGQRLREAAHLELAIAG